MTIWMMIWYIINLCMNGIFSAATLPAEVSGQAGLNDSLKNPSARQTDC